MSKYVLELKNYEIGPNAGLPHVSSHLYWAVKNTETGDYLDGYTFHGGAIGTDGWLNGVGFFSDKVGISDNFGSHELDSDRVRDGGISVLEFDTLEDIENVKNIFKATGDEINALDENYGVFFDNSNSVAYLLGRSLGLSDTQLQEFAGQLNTGTFGALGFGDDLLNGANGDYADMNVEEFLQKAKKSDIITNEQIQAATEKAEELPKPSPIERTQAAQLINAEANTAFMSDARLAGQTEKTWLDKIWEQPTEEPGAMPASSAPVQYPEMLSSHGEQPYVYCIRDFKQNNVINISMAPGAQVDLEEICKQVLEGVAASHQEIFGAFDE